jgi:hypothetical protein
MRTVLLSVGLISLSFALGACGGASDPEDACQPGQIRCQGDRLEGCAYGQWVGGTDCGQLGQGCGPDPVTGEPACLPETPNCTEDSLRCAGALLERCVADAWQSQTDCGQLGQSCGPDPITGEPACLDDPPNCVEDSLRCTADTLERCVADAWQTETDCAQLGQSCGADPVTGEPTCLDDTPNCAEDSLRCTADTLERCVADAWQTETDCLAQDQLCRVDPDSGVAACQPLTWNRIPIEIDDPIVNGSSLMMPIDSPSFGYDAVSGLMATSFSSAYDDPLVLFLWLLDTATGLHYKLFLNGDPLPADTPFCSGGENWCQYLGFDPVSAEWIVVGPSSPSLMRVDATGQARRVATSGTRPPDSWISHTHRYDWIDRKLYEYGAVGPSDFGNGLYALDLDSGVWSQAVTRLPPIVDNCLVVDPAAGLAYSFGGETTSDGGITVTPVATYRTIDLTSASSDALPLPAAMGARRGMNCALDAARGLVFLLGGSLVNDNWNEIENEYHNDLWVLRTSDGVFTQLLADGPLGTFRPPDSYGDRAFEADPALPNFGRNAGKMIHSAAEDRLMVVGAVPIFTHEQCYWLDLDGVEALLAQ